MPDGQLSPGAVAGALFGLAPDRDERAPQLCQEALLTLALNGYEHADADQLATPPKRERFALRSLALGENFLSGIAEGRAGDNDTTPQRYGDRLANGEEMPGSAHLPRIRDALEGLIDPDTAQGQRGGWLLFPFHESLLWYDARRSGLRWGVRRVYMRGGGITIARLLARPPARARHAELGRAAVQALRGVLQAPSPLAEIADHLERPLASLDAGPRDVEGAEQSAWALGGEERLIALADRLCADAEGIANQGGASAPAKLWQLRSILALDVALHALRTAWAATETPGAEQFLLLSFAGPPRAENRIRQRSEDSYARARIKLQEAILRELTAGLERFAAEGTGDWAEQFVSRMGQLSDQIDELAAGGLDREGFARVAREIVDKATYDRPVAGFSGLIQTAGLLAGTGQYRYLTASPELLAALVGALSSRMPMSSDEFFDAVFEEWGLVIEQTAAARTALSGEVDGAQLERNGRRAEQQLADSGLALSLSDRTTVVGERAGRFA